MKIVYLVHDIDVKNGGGRFAHDLIYGVKNAGHEVIILKEQDEGLGGVVILKRGAGIFFSALKARKFMKNCDIIHALDGYPYGVIAALANKSLKNKLIITVQGTYSVAPLYNWKISRLLKWAYQKANEFVAISNYTKNEILKKVKLKNIEVINHGVDLSKFERPRLNSDEEFIISVGALKVRKGYHISIPAFALVKKEIPSLKYKIIGSQNDKNYFEYLKKLAIEHGVEKDIEFLTDIPEEKLSFLYQTAKLFILTSVNQGHHFEGFGLVFLEAAASGLPVIGTLENGIEGAVKNNHNGILVNQNSINKTAQAIISILKDEEKQKQMSSNSYIWAKEHNVSLTVSKYLSLYKNL